MSFPFTYTRYSDRVTSGSWTLATGTARSGYPLTNLDDGDPSAPLWIESTSLSVVRDMGSATRVDAVDIYAHTFATGCDLRVQLHTADSWGAPDASITVSIPTPHADGFTVHLRANFAAAYSVSGRTKRYLRVANLSANGVSVAIGEVCIWGETRTLARGVRHFFLQPRQRLTSGQRSKRGVQTRYDYGSIERALIVEVPASDTDVDDLRALEVDARGDAQPFSVVLASDYTKARFAEPMLVRLTNSVGEAPYGHPTAMPVRLRFEELGCGELVGA